MADVDDRQGGVALGREQRGDPVFGVGVVPGGEGRALHPDLHVDDD
jgi:hypothetical protein